MQLALSARTDVGQVRRRNEDAIWVDKALGLFVVADGMGGHQGGRTASHLAVRTIFDVIDAAMGTPFSDPGEPARACLGRAVGAASEAIYQTSLRDSATHGMGTTTTAIWILEGRVHVAHVGDSRLYLQRDLDLVQVTHDHSLVEEHLRAGVITEEEALNSGYKNIITRSVGFEAGVEVDTLVVDAYPGDTYMLCSDGLSNLVTAEEINDHMIREDVTASVESLVDLANAQGGDDNISVIMLRILGEKTGRPLAASDTQER